MAQVAYKKKSCLQRYADYVFWDYIYEGARLTQEVVIEGNNFFKIRYHICWNKFLMMRFVRTLDSSLERGVEIFGQTLISCFRRQPVVRVV